MVRETSGVGRWLRELRELNGLSQNTVANKMKVHQTAISQWESGRTKPSIEMLGELALLYGVSIDTIMGNKAGANNNSEIVELVKLRDAISRTPELKMLLIHMLSMDTTNIKRAIKVVKAMSDDD